MGWRSRRRRKKLRKELIEQGKLDTYRKRLKQYVITLEKKEQSLVVKVKDLKTKDAYLAKSLIRHIQEIKGLIKRIQRVNIFLDNYESKQETAAVYEDLLDYLNESNKAAGKAPSKRKNRKALNKSQRKIKDLNQLFDFIDKKIGKFDKYDVSEDPASSQSLDAIDVDAFLKDYE